MAIKERVRKSPSNAQRFPYIPLPRALAKARELYKMADSYDVPVNTAIKSWGYSEKSSGGGLIIAALKYFGLLEDFGSSENRKVKLTSLALKIIKDPREISPERDALIKQAALLPPIHREVVEKYSGMPPSDESFRAYLLLDRGFKDAAAEDFIKEFMQTMNYAQISSLSSSVEIAEDTLLEPSEQEIEKEIAVGDYIQWISQDVAQFAQPVRVVWTSDDGTFVRVEGSMTGIPVAQVEKMPTPVSPVIHSPIKSIDEIEAHCTTIKDLNEIKVLLDGSRLRISAFVDLKGLKKLKRILEAHAALLEEDEE